jgi:hypothetical protein
MKLMSAPCTAAVLLGISALIHPITSFALPTCGVCSNWWTECHRDPRSSACLSWKLYCRACAPPAGHDSAPPGRHDEEPTIAWLDVRRAASSTAK